MDNATKAYAYFTDYYSQSSFFLKSSIAYIAVILSLLFTVRRQLKRKTPTFEFQLKGPSNLRDEFEYSAEQAPGQKIRVKSLWIYPVKGCRGIELEKSRIVETGFQYDRQLMFATRKTSSDPWVFASQRGFAKMALLSTSIDPTNNTVTLSYPVPTSFPASLFSLGKNSFTVPLNVNVLPEKDKAKIGRANVDLWGTVYETCDLSGNIPDECKRIIFEVEKKKVQVGLFAVYAEKPRVIATKSTPKVEVLGRDTVTGFADIYPVHLLSLSSVRALNAKPTVHAEIPCLSARRFRPNIITSGSPAFDEDDWSSITIGTSTPSSNNKYHVIARTPRCKVPNNDPDTGVRNINEPDVTIRRERNIDEGIKLKGCMGMHLVPWDDTVEVRVGDEVVVEGRTDGHRWG